MNSIPFFSIVVPVFNKEQNIKSTIDSVLNQTFTDFELVLVNDGSTDSSLKVIESFNDSRIVLIDKKNGGVSSARNTGILNSKGDYISFLDADDIWEASYLMKMRELALDFPEASFFGCQFGQKRGEHIFVVNEIHKSRGYVSDFFKESIQAPLIWTSCAVVKKDCFNKIGFFNEKLSRGEDIDIWIRLAKNYKMAFEPTLLCYYIIDAQNRVCVKDFPLNKHFYKFKFRNSSKFEKEYYVNRASFIIAEKIKYKRLNDLIKLAFQYNFYLPKIFNKILKRKLEYINEDKS